MSSSGAGQSSVGSRTLYEAGDQRNVPQSEINEQNRYAEGQKNSHKTLDSSKHAPSCFFPLTLQSLGIQMLTTTNRGPAFHWQQACCTRTQARERPPPQLR